MLRHGHLAEVRQRMFQRPPAHREEPAERLEPEDLALVVEADVLQVVEQPLLGGPEPRGGILQQGRQGPDPEAGLPFLHEQGLAKPDREPIERGPGRCPLGLSGVRSGLPGRSRPEDRRPDVVPPLARRPGPFGHFQRMTIGPAPHRSPARVRPDPESAGPIEPARRGGRLGCAGRPGRGQECLAVNVPGQDGLDRTDRLDRGEDRRPRPPARRMSARGRPPQTRRRPTRRTPAAAPGHPAGAPCGPPSNSARPIASIRASSPAASIAPDSSDRATSHSTRPWNSRRQASVRTGPGSAPASSSGSGSAIRRAVSGQAGPPVGPAPQHPRSPRAPRPGSRSTSDASRPATGARGPAGSPGGGSGRERGSPTGRPPPRRGGVRRVRWPSLHR